MKTANQDELKAAPTGNFICAWCEIAEVENPEYPPDDYGGWDADTGKPICYLCAAVADEEKYYDEK